MNEERFWLLVSLQLSEEATPEELEELNTFLEQHPEKHLQVEIVRNIWKNERQTDPAYRHKSFDKHLQRLSNHLSEPVLQFESTASGPAPEPGMDSVPRRTGIRRLLVAAGIAASFLVFFLLFTLPEEEPATVAGNITGNTVVTRPGSKSQITLPDGTQVWINADSKITYDQHFAGKIREVHLTGEAYFDVVRDTTRPFIIHTRSIDVKVLGTSFNIRSYPNEKTTETALIHGSVEVTLHHSPDKKIVLKPNEKLIINNQLAGDSAEEATELVAEEPMLTLGKVRYNKADSSSSVEVMWVKNKLAFENETFERMVREMERWYNVSFTVKNEQLKSLHFYGVFENKSLEEVLEALSYSRQFHYEIKDGNVTIW